MAGRVSSFLRNVLLREHDASGVTAFVERAELRLKDLRELEGRCEGTRLFRSGCEFGVEAAGICLMELIDRENGVAPPDTKRRLARISYLHSLDKTGEKKLRRAVMRTRRAIKTLLSLRLPEGCRPEGNWEASTVPFSGTEPEHRRLLPNFDTIIARRISESEHLSHSDRTPIMSNCTLFLSRSKEFGLEGVMLGTVVDVAIVLAFGKGRHHGSTRDLVEMLGLKSTVLNHISSIRKFRMEPILIGHP